VKSVITTGGTADAYQAGGHNNFTMRELLRPLEQTARLCGMDYEEPIILHGALHVDAAGCAGALKTYRDWLLQN
jgi:glutathione-regulated potassium-efflux system ancillary protein KefG